MNAPPASAGLHPVYPRLLSMLLKGQGADVEAVLAQAGLSWPQLSAGDEPLALAQLAPLFRVAQELTGRPWLGVDLGQMAQASAHGALGRAVVASRDLGQALEVVVRFSALRTDLLSFELVREGDRAVLRVRETVALGAARSFMLDAVFGTALRLIETVVGHRLPGLHIDMPGPMPEWHAHYRICHDGVLNFGSDCLSISLPLGDLALPCLTADARAYAVACDECEWALTALPNGRGGPWSRRVSQQLRVGLAAQRLPDLHALAQAECVSPRTLIRRLAAEGSSYQGLLDELRQAQALALLRDDVHAIEDIAAQLGFADTSNFSRTARRWFGLTPSALRERLRTASS